ncbi:MAG: PASTA domain-containing protein [Microthrixaceae bacterium]
MSPDRAPDVGDTDLDDTDVDERDRSDEIDDPDGSEEFEESEEVEEIEDPGSEVDPEDRVTLVGAPEEVDLEPHGTATAVGLVALVLLFLLVTAGLASARDGAVSNPSAPRVEVPSVAGRTVEEAQRSLESLGLLVALDYRPNEVVPAGVVFGQRPVAGAFLEAGTEVTLEVSDGPGGIVVPAVTGVQGPVAAALLQALGLAPRLEPVPDDVVRPGEVIGTRPAAGGRAGAGSEVVVLTSAGPAPRTVPPIVGGPQGPGLSQLARAGLGLGPVTSEYRPGVESGVVLATDPPPGTPLPPRTPVAVTVSAPAPTLTAPSLVGLLQATAERVVPSELPLSARGRQLAPDDTRAGRVLEQSVPAGTPVAPGTPIQVVVGVAPPPPPTTAAPTVPPPGQPGATTTTVR